MINVSEFEVRHEFSCSTEEELNILRDKYKSIIFLNIPESWIYIIDEAISRLEHPSDVKIIQQICGLLVLAHNENMSPKDIYILNKMERKLYEADFDLHQEMAHNVELN